MVDIKTPRRTPGRLVAGALLAVLIGLTSQYMLALSPLLFLAPVLTALLYAYAGAAAAVLSCAVQLGVAYASFGAALAVILLNGAVFRDVDSIIYGLLFNFLVAAVINKMMFGFASSMLALIVTGDGKAACREIDRVADRGSTILQGRGGYGGQPKDVVLCACSNKQLYEIEHAVRAIDPGCFIIMLQSNEVQGEGFRRLELGKSEGNN